MWRSGITGAVLGVRGMCPSRVTTRAWAGGESTRHGQGARKKRWFHGDAHGEPVSSSPCML
eukprot:5503535-Prorocentrum_lima.AAC.1